MWFKKQSWEITLKCMRSNKCPKYEIFELSTLLKMTYQNINGDCIAR